MADEEGENFENWLRAQVTQNKEKNSCNKLIINAAWERKIQLTKRRAEKMHDYSGKNELLYFPVN